MFAILQSSPIFKGLNSNEINSLLNSVLYQIRHFSKNEVIAYSGDRVEKAIILLEGKLQGIMADYAGNSIKIEELNPPQMVAPAFLYGPECFFPVNLSALSDGIILVLYKQEFTNLLAKDLRILNNYLNIVSGKAQFLSGKITFLSYKTIREKIAYFLLNKMEVDSLIISMNQSQKKLAEIFGVARPSFARTISEMEKSGIIRWEKNKVTITDLKSLKTMLIK